MQESVGIKIVIGTKIGEGTAEKKVLLLNAVKPET